MIQLFHAVRDGPRARAPNQHPQAEPLLLIRPNGPMRTKFEEEQNTMTLKKIGALVLALVMVLTISTTAFAAEIPGNYGTGSEEEGVNGQFNTGVGADNPTTTDKNINIKKVITAFNPNGTTVHAPVVTYTYTVTSPDVTGLTITDENADHTTNTAVQVPVKAGIITGLVATGVNAAGTATAGSNDGTSAVANLVFDNTSTWTTAAAGQDNEYDINLNFTGVSFTQPGVYRYQIAETISTTLANIGMEAGTGAKTLYLDVYVDGNLDIYGYVCMTANSSITPAATTKVNGFVNGTNNDAADKYYTYDLVLSKDVVNDTYAAINIAFPFTVFFNNSENYTSTFVIDQTVGSGSTGLNSSAATLTLATSAVSLSGVALVKDGNATASTTVGDITLTGIPAGMDVDVYETNIATGVTYTVDTSVTGGTAVTDNPVTSGSTPASAVAQGASRADYESTKATVDTTTITSTDEQSVAITNTLVTISPTGVTLRIAPYALMLIGGVTLFIILAVKRRKNEEEEPA